jgi:hypothetical protein
MFYLKCFIGYLLLIALFISCDNEDSVIVEDPAFGIIVKGQILSESGSELADIKVVGEFSLNPDCRDGFFHKDSMISDLLGNFMLSFGMFGRSRYGCIKVLALPDSDQFYKSDTLIFSNIHFKSSLDTLNVVVVLNK